jgi:5-formyltetrahydrofolate cyclo-ligase
MSQLPDAGLILVANGNDTGTGALSAEDRAYLESMRNAPRARVEQAQAAHDHALAPDAVIRAKVKAELRKRMRALRNHASPDLCATRSAAIVQKLLTLDALAGAKSIAMFLPIRKRNEVDVSALVKFAAARGAAVAIPRVVGAEMVFYNYAAGDTLQVSAFGVPEPTADAVCAGQPDVVIVPALLVDPRGYRIGYGGGYYDKWFAATPVTPRPFVAVVAFDFQLVAEVPEEPWDIQADYVITEKRVLCTDSATVEAR